MKCVCGYEKLGEGIQEDGQWRDADPEKEDFGQFYVVCQKYGYEYAGSRSKSYFPVEMTMYACPECGTLKVNV